MRQEHLEAAVPVGADPRRYARVLAQAHEAALSGARPPTAPRPVIGASWQRMRLLGLDPDHGRDDPPLPEAELEARRRGSGLADALPILRGGLISVAEEAAHIMVVVDGDARVLWRDGSAAVRHRADRLGFTEGASWHENRVGTNAIGTALVARRPMQVYSAEHYVRSHHAWTCAAAPLHDPRDGRLLGVVDLSGPAATVHASTLALVDAVARLAESQLRNAHLAELERLRAATLPALAKVDGRALVTDEHGWVAAVSGLAPVDRVTLPAGCGAGQAWLPAFGTCRLEPVPGGWLVRLAERDEGEPVPTTAVLDVRSPRECVLTVTGESGAWSYRLSPRHAEMLYVLARHRDGRSAAELALDLFGDPERTVTVRAEMSRLRRRLGGILARRPYRFADDIDVVFQQPDEPDLVLPHSTAPAIRGRG
ncbi:helix-turn-helix domain-containing protein [Prauserella muralis]|uniref:Diguanylate cyclase n=1 Tax=Prauserella muralis TaxID=588067 RepID=A0A2V4BL46_9PSEU|nr:helix-turn-helix domain-containing protein [Prauserella muralis]PXY31353.1 diguanylate cyclase [Prauserella muralis]TWE14325.1 GAF domain-containing protein [Prauserella muralis]